MCGIAGILMHKGLPDKQAVDLLARSLEHRGPDGSGYFDHEATSILHKRLSIIDLETGNQPIQNQENSVIIVNGEIYNYLELREVLGEKNFHTKSDCEPPLLMYELNGDTFAKELRGMYAIAIFDTKKHILSKDIDQEIFDLKYYDTSKIFGAKKEWYKNLNEHNIDIIYRIDQTIYMIQARIIDVLFEF